MWPFRKKEVRNALEVENGSITDSLLQALIGTTTITREMALQIPSVKASVQIIKDVISSLPIKLYDKSGNKLEEIKDDVRVALINDDSKGNMTGSQLKKAIVDNYLLDKGAYIYVEKIGTKYKSLRFVESNDINIYRNEDPIFKTYDVMVRGVRFPEYNFIKIIRNTTDGFTGHSIIEENPLIIAVAYNSLVFENKLVKKGGNKKGFLTSEHSLTESAIDSLKAAWSNLYSNDEDNVVILNSGMDFKESSNTSVEMQLNENKLTNSQELSMLFNVANAIIRGNATENDIKNFVKFCLVPILVDIESSLNRDFLLEKEKGRLYWAFDTTEINRGSFKDRMEAYGIALDKNIYQLDEVREKEDLPELGFNYIKLGLDSVLYDPKNKTIYTPNTNQTQTMDEMNQSKGGEDDANRNKE